MPEMNLVRFSYHAVKHSATFCDHFKARLPKLMASASAVLKKAASWICMSCNPLVEVTVGVADIAHVT